MVLKYRLWSSGLWPWLVCICISASICSSLNGDEIKQYLIPTIVFEDEMIYILPSTE